MGKHGCLYVPDRVVPVLPPPAANEPVVTSDVPLPLGTLTRVPKPAPLDMLTTGTLVTPLATVPGAPAEPTAPLAVAAELALPLTKVATDVFERVPPGVALAFLAALMTAAWLAATNSEGCGEVGFPASVACWETQLSIKQKTFLIDSKILLLMITIKKNRRGTSVTINRLCFGLVSPGARCGIFP